MSIEKLKCHKSPGIYQIPAELFKAWGRIIRCEIQKLIISIWKKEELLFVFFWVIPRRLIHICRRFGTLYLFPPATYFLLVPVFSGTTSL